MGEQKHTCGVMGAGCSQACPGWSPGAAPHSELSSLRARLAEVEAERDHFRNEEREMFSKWAAACDRAESAERERDELDTEAKTINRMHDEAKARAEKAEAERDALQRFKDYVHKRLDDAGVPADPGSPHKEKGCRIGGRLDWVLARADKAEAELEAMRKSDSNWASLAGIERVRAEAAEARVSDLLKRLSALAAYAPHEVVKDDFAYDRLLEAVRDFARAALSSTPEKETP